MRIPLRVTAAVCLCAFACGDQSEAARTPLKVSGEPIALDTQLVFVDAENHNAFLLDVSAKRPKAEGKRVQLARGATHAVRRAGGKEHPHDEALILCEGERGNTMVDAEPAALIAIDAKAKARRYLLGTTQFNTLTQSDDGRYAVLYRSGPISGRTLNNPNELVVVDLDAEPDAAGAVTRKTPDGLAHTISSVIVSQPMRIAEEDRRLLVVLSAAEVTLFDLGHLGRRATIVSLDETRSVNPVQVVFSASQPIMYVRAQNSDNIFMFRFEKHDNDRDASGELLGNDFRPSINPISGGAGPRDITLFGAEEPRLLVVAEGSSQALVIDPSSSKTTALRLAQPAQHILMFSGTSPTDSRSRTRALLYSDKTALTFLDPEELGDQPNEHIEQLTASNPINSVIPLLGQHEAVLLHASGVTIVDLEKRTLTPIAANSTLSGALFDPTHGRLWVAQSHEPWIGTLDLATGRTDEVLLDVNVGQIVPMFELNRLAVVHDSAIGYLTLLDLDAPSRETAISLRGFFISDRLDRGE